MTAQPTPGADIEAGSVPAAAVAHPPTGLVALALSRPLMATGTLGAGLALVSLVALVLPGSVLHYDYAINMDRPLLEVYRGAYAELEVFLIFGLLMALFVSAVILAKRLSSREAAGLVLGVTAVLVALYVLAYPTGARDIFKNISDARTLWTYGDNPLQTAPSAHTTDPLYKSLTYPNWRTATGYYGPLYYFMAGPPAKLAGDGVLANMLAFKVYNGVGVLLLTLVVGYGAGLVAPGRRIQAMVLVGWNPLVLYEGVANAHNDLFMALFAVASLVLLVKVQAFRGFFALAASALVKYVTAFLAPAAFLWLWLRGSRRERIVLGGMAAAALVGMAVLIPVVFHNKQLPLGVLNVDMTLQSPLHLLDVGFRNLGLPHPLRAARYICVAGFAIAAGAALLRLDRTPRSLFAASFWTMAAASVLANSYSWPWYALWFVPIAAVIVGTIEADIAVVASVCNLLAYAVFPWFATTINMDAYYVFITVILPLMYLYAVWALGLPSITGRPEPQANEEAAA